MKKILLLGGYGTVGSVVAKDLSESGFFVGIAGRNEKKISELRNIIGESFSAGHILDFSNEAILIAAMKEYDVVLNCVEYTLNQMILQACISAKKHYIDLGDYYEGIITSRSHDTEIKNAGIVGLLGAGSSPGIINVLIAHIAREKKSVQEVVISFSDVIREADEKMLPFNFQTVVEEISGQALAFENGKYTFVPGSSKSLTVDFGPEFGKADCYVTNHDEQYSLPVFFQEKGIKNCYFVMNHNPKYLKLIPLLQEFGFFSDTKISVNSLEISPREFLNGFMKRYLPAEFRSDDKEMLYARVDDSVVTIVNSSVDGVPAGIINTGVGASLIAQYVANYKISPGIHHPEDCIDSDWMISELEKRNFTVKIEKIM